MTQTTDAQGIYEFIDLRPGTYTITETQPTTLGGLPTSFIDGQDVLGEVVEHEPPTPPVVLGFDGVVDPNGNDAFSGIELVAGSQGVNYNFGERMDGGQLPGDGVTATIGFWQNKNGQALIESLNGSQQSTLLSDYLASTFPNMYGANAGEANLSGLSNKEVAEVYQRLFKRNNKTSPGGPPKLDAQVMSVALATYVTKESLAGLVYDLSGTTHENFLFTDQDGDGFYEPSDGDAATIDTALLVGVESFGFHISIGGVGSMYFNVGDSGEAFDGFDDFDEAMVIDLLLATDRMSSDGLLYDQNDDDRIDELEEVLRILANDFYCAINEQGEI
jgi:hypothetical protein